MKLLLSLIPLPCPSPLSLPLSCPSPLSIPLSPHQSQRVWRGRAVRKRDRALVDARNVFLGKKRYAILIQKVSNYLSNYLSMCLSIYLSSYLSMCLSIYLSFFPCYACMINTNSTWMRHMLRYNE